MVNLVSVGNTCFVSLTVFLDPFRKFSGGASWHAQVCCSSDKLEGPVVSADGGYIRDIPAIALQDGKFQQPLPMILGHNAREVKLNLSIVVYQV